MFTFCSVYDGQTLSETAPGLARGWDEWDVQQLDELAGLGMDLVRVLTRQVQAYEEACQRGEAEVLSAAQTGRVSLDFSRISRAIRMTLGLKAIARGAEAPGAGPARRLALANARTGRDDDDDDDGEAAGETYAISVPWPPGPDTPSPDDPDACRAYVADQIRLALDHALSGPTFDRAEAERLREAFEAGIDAERDNPRFPYSSYTHVIEDLCKDLGLRVDWRAGLGEDGEFRRWVAIFSPEDRSRPLTLPDPAVEMEAMRARWPRARPPPD